MGQQTCPSNMSHPAIEPDRVKKSKSRFEAERKIPSESEGKSSDFARYGMVVIAVISADASFVKPKLDSTADRIDLLATFCRTAFTPGPESRCPTSSTTTTLKMGRYGTRRARKN